MGEKMTGDEVNIREFDPDKVKEGFEKAAREAGRVADSDGTVIRRFDPDELNKAFSAVDHARTEALEQAESSKPNQADIPTMVVDMSELPPLPGQQRGIMAKISKFFGKK